MPKHIRSRVVLKKSKVIYKNLTDGIVGFAYKDEEDENLVEVDPNQSDAQLILSLIHELAHNLLPNLSEPNIIKLEKTFGKNIWLCVMRLRRKWYKKWTMEHSKIPLKK